MKKPMAAAIAVLVLLVTPVAGASTVSERDTHIQKYLNRELIPDKDIDAWAHPKQVRVTDGFFNRPSILKAAWVQAIVEVGYVKPPKLAPVYSSTVTPSGYVAPSSGVGASAGVSGIICDVFGPYCSEAISVATCESTLNPAAVNGQYLGLFQMGEYARSQYGHGSDAYTQSVAAYGYFRDTGFTWSPWACKP